jgi:hypothetical protein
MIMENAISLKHCVKAVMLVVLIFLYIIYKQYKILQRRRSFRLICQMSSGNQYFLAETIIALVKLVIVFSIDTYNDTLMVSVIKHHVHKISNLYTFVSL